jgi:hypothetical protein
MANRNQNSPRTLLRREKPLDRSRPMSRKLVTFIAILMLGLPLFTLAQDDDDKGRAWGDYIVHQSIELGGHIADAEGNQQMYATFVNLRSGPRLLGQDLSMQSTHHQGLLFDTLYLSSFGFGGDPEGMARLRIQKNKWYNFVGLYRRDKNFFDYDLFANPLNLNAGITTCGVGCTNNFNPQSLPWFTNSPHLQATTRNMGDFMLTLLPDSKVSFRLGYARNASYGTIDTTLEDPHQTILTEESQWRSDRYQFGADLKMIPRTTISGDVFFEHDKNDIGFLDATLLFALGNSGGPPVDIGFQFPPLSGTLPPCAGANLPTINPGNVFIINSGCKNGVLLATGPGGGYFRRGNVRTDIPTGQLSLQSNYFRNLDITASATYSSASSDYLNYNEFSQSARTGPNPYLISGSPSAGHISASANLGLTYHISKSWSFSDTFRWLDWRQSGANSLTQFNCFLNGATLATGPDGAVGFPGGVLTLSPLFNPCNSTILALSGLTTSGNAARGTTYEQISANTALVGERSYFNTAKLNWQPSRRLSAYVGYRYARRELKDGNLAIGGVLTQTTSTFANDGTGTVPTTPTVVTTSGEVDSARINLHTLLLGVVVRPVEAWRINADVELLSADNFFTNISPRHQQRVRAYSTFKVNRWASINGGVHFVESRNDFAQSAIVESLSGVIAANVDGPLFPAGFVPFEYGHKDHWRSYTLGATLTPNSKFTFDFGWTLLDQDIRSATCMPLSTATVFFGVFPASTSPPAACNNAATARALLLSYQEKTNTGYANLSFHPVKRVTLNLGYEVTSDSGSTDWLRADSGLPLQVVGDIYGNSPPLAGNPITPCPGASVATGCAFAGPFPAQPLGPQAFNWHKFNTGISYEVVKGITFHGLWSYYDYNAKDENPILAPLTVVAPRDFHANVGTVSLRYTF